MNARTIIDCLCEEDSPPDRYTKADPYVTLVAEINAFLDDGNLSDYEKTRDLAGKAKALAAKTNDPERQDELKRLAGVLISHYRYYARK